MAMAMAPAVPSFLPSKQLPPPQLLPPTLLPLSSQLHLCKPTNSKWTPLALRRSSPGPDKYTPTTSGSTSTDYLTSSFSSLMIVCPSLAYANTLYFKSGEFNVQINVKDNEPEESVVLRFRRAVLRARILQECKRRRFFESTQEKKKRKTRAAARRNSKRRPQPRPPLVKQEAYKKTRDEDEDEDDNWELPEGEIPYC